jgi:hypothetical protein
MIWTNMYKFWLVTGTVSFGLVRHAGCVSVKGNMYVRVRTKNAVLCYV